MLAGWCSRYLPVPLLVLTAMVLDFERRQMQASAPFAKASLAACT